MFQRGFKKYSKKELIYGPILIDSNKEYFNYLLKKQTGILENIPKYKIITRLKMRKKVFFLKRLGNTNV